MKNLVIAFVILCCMAASATQSTSHCDSSELVIFNCQIKGSPKFISLCGSKQLSKEVGYLQYRFGRPGNIELEFPAEKQNSQARFLFAHYFRPLVDRKQVSFINGVYKYSVYDFYEGDTKPVERNRGVSIDYNETKENASQSEKSVPAKSRELVCTGPVISQLIKLEEVIPCDKEFPLNSCP